MLSKPFNFFICFLFLFTVPNSSLLKLQPQMWNLFNKIGHLTEFSEDSIKLLYKEDSKFIQKYALLVMGLRHISYRDLEGIGYSNDEIKVIAGEYEITDGPNDEGEMFTRDAKMSDKFVGPYENDKIARLANNGAYPPDLSLIVKARAGGADYIYSLLNGYKDFPENFEASEGMYYNEYYPGNQIAMPPQIEDDIVEFDDGTIATHNQIARDITSFLAWTAEPELERRKSLGVKTLFFLVLITIMLLGVKRKVWKHLD